MLQAMLCIKTEYNNTRAIALEASNFGGQAFTAQVNASQAEKTITRYSNNNGSNKSDRSGSTLKGPLCCYGCGGPHPWSLLENEIHEINCPDASNRGIRKNAKKVNERIQNKRKKETARFNEAQEPCNYKLQQL